jgi:riboflavin transporter FmnP
VSLMDAIIGMYQKLIPSVNGLLSCLVIFNMPFTFVKGILCSIITFLIYKPISGFIKGR